MLSEKARSYRNEAVLRQQGCLKEILITPKIDDHCPVVVIHPFFDGLGFVQIGFFRNGQAFYGFGEGDEKSFCIGSKAGINILLFIMMITAFAKTVFWKG